MYRYNYAVQKCMAMIRAGELGEIYQIGAEMSTYHSAQYRKWLKNFSGGSMYIFGSHPADLIVSILDEPERVHPFIKQISLENVYSDDNNFAVPEYKKAIAKITTLSVEVNGWGMCRFAVFGSKRTVEIKPIELDVKMTKATSPLWITGISQLFGGAVLLYISLKFDGKIPQVTPKALLVFAYICTASITGYTLFYRSQRTTELSKLFIIKFSEPLFACVFSALLIGEDIFKIQYLIAFVLISPGIVIGNAKNSKPKIA